MRVPFILKFIRVHDKHEIKQTYAELRTIIINLTVRKLPNIN